MALKPCVFCGRRFTGAPVTAYWRTQAPDGESVLYIQKADYGCAGSRWRPLVEVAQDREADEPLPESCPHCGIDMDGQLRLIYASMFRGKARKDLVVSACADCFTAYIPLISTGAEIRRESPGEGGAEGGTPPSQGASGKPVEGLPW